MMRKYLFLFFSAIVLFACKQEIEKPERLIDQSTMTDIVYDVTLLNAMKGHHRVKLQDYRFLPSDYLYTKYGIDSLQFATSNKYYTLQPSVYEQILKAASARLKEQKEEYEVIKKRKDSIKKEARKKRQDSIKKNKGEGVVETEAAIANVDTPEGVFFYVENRVTNNYLSPEISKDGSIVLDTAKEEVDASAQWEKVATDPGFFYLKNKDSGKFLALKSIDADADVLLMNESYEGYFSQWTEVKRDGGYVHLKNRFTEKYVRPTSRQKKIIQKPVTFKGAWTQWKFVKASEDTARSQQSTAKKVEKTKEKKPAKPIKKVSKEILNDLDDIDF